MISFGWPASLKSLRIDQMPLNLAESTLIL